MSKKLVLTALIAMVVLCADLLAACGVFGFLPEWLVLLLGPLVGLPAMVTVCWVCWRAGQWDRLHEDPAEPATDSRAFYDPGSAVDLLGVHLEGVLVLSQAVHQHCAGTYVLPEGAYQGYLKSLRLQMAHWLPSDVYDRGLKRPWS